jgi:predicted amidohydrolase
LTIKIATVVPRTYFGESSESINFENFARYVKEASDKGAELVVFPESYPDNWQPPASSELLDKFKFLAKKYGIHIIGSILEPIPESKKFYNTCVLISDLGEEIGRYRRTTPNLDPWLYMGGGKWEYQWERDNKLPIFETRFGTIGILICSEIYAPLLTTTLARKGATIVVYPTGLTSDNSPLIETWKTMAWARAIENLCITVVTSNSTGEGGLSMICSPEEILISTTDEGVHLSEVDLARVQLLRTSHDMFMKNGPEVPFKTKPGIFLDWVREDLES